MPPQAEPWTVLDERQYEAAWARFDERLHFRASVSPDGWPGIAEPKPSITFDLSVIADGAPRGAEYDAINAEALRAIVWAVPETDEWFALDWQHPAYRFRPSALALTWQAEWKIPVFPDGDYFAFVTPDLATGTFGHPWEQTLCVFGNALVGTLAATLSTWLPVKRVDGH